MECDFDMKVMQWWHHFDMARYDVIIEELMKSYWKAYWLQPHLTVGNDKRIMKIETLTENNAQVANSKGRVGLKQIE